MTAHLIPIQERFQRFPNIVGLGARLALLEADCQELRADLTAAIENPVAVMTPFGLSEVAAEAAELTYRFGAHEPDDPVIYKADEDEWATDEE